MHDTPLEYKWLLIKPDAKEEDRESGRKSGIGVLPFPFLGAGALIESSSSAAAAYKRTRI